MIGCALWIFRLITCFKRVIALSIEYIQVKNVVPPLCGISVLLFWEPYTLSWSVFFIRLFFGSCCSVRVHTKKYPHHMYIKTMKRKYSKQIKFSAHINGHKIEFFCAFTLSFTWCVSCTSNIIKNYSQFTDVILFWRINHVHIINHLSRSDGIEICKVVGDDIAMDLVCEIKLFHFMEVFSFTTYRSSLQFFIASF